MKKSEDEEARRHADSLRLDDYEGKKKKKKLLFSLS